MPETKYNKIIVIGTSAGGMQALIKLLAGLPEDLPASIFIVQHLSADSSAAFLVNRLNQFTSLTCKVAEHQQEFEPGTVYFAPADKHLLLSKKEMLVVTGPRENQFRPAIDPLFRSAAAYHGASTIGVVLTGFMSDGVIGMESIKRSGGVAVVQHPDDAEFPVLPENVIRQVNIDHVVALEEMSSILEEVSRQQPSQSSVTVPSDIWQEAQIAERVMTNSTLTNIDELDKAGDRTVYSCPECGGGLWELSQEGTIKRFRCHSGHAFSEDSLLDGMSNALEETLWVALRTLEERRNILQSMSRGETTKGNHRWASIQETRAEEMKVHIERLRELLSRSASKDEEQMGETG
ncbi:chemotaxis protein CheB [Pontibacter cellulosilyticus]|uniref:protein-glutamate methylesterase n=1 Tax=Pontibacter cellulosilyticus TaxID=1720253 RepID=A0A923N7D7_9BACT|nr:chemotaxis protein CheB [Pontibacter cellulosilyticus]MBC5992252.1 chemotaxis protein CheB [Pontibacter cellulosilyticus]